MARRKRVEEGAGGPLTDADYLRELHLLAQPFAGCALMVADRPADDPVRAEAEADVRDVAHAVRRNGQLPPSERVRRFRAWLADRGWLERAERHLASLEAARREGGW